MIFALLSRSASACFAIALCISTGRSTFFTSTAVTFTPKAQFAGLSPSEALHLFPLFLPRGHRAGSGRECFSGLSGTSVRLRNKVLHCCYRLYRVHNPEVYNSIHLDRDIVPCDYILRRDIKGNCPETHPHKLVNYRNYNNKSRPFYRNYPPSLKTTPLSYSLNILIALEKK